MENKKIHTENENFNHISVLQEESIASLNIKSDGIYVDGTLGGGGHTGKILNKIGKNGLVIGIDQDDTALEFNKKQYKNYIDNGQLIIIKGNFSDIDKILEELNIDKVNAFFLDIGVSSPQIDNQDRGFSYINDGPLDMRMNNDQQLTAKEVVNGLGEKELSKIFIEYGEEKFSSRIAKNIVNYRNQKVIETTAELSDIIRNSFPKKILFSKKRPEAKVFQALRIYVNDEINSLKIFLKKSVKFLKPNGRISIITFHSLEDRIVKKYFVNKTKVDIPDKVPVVDSDIDSGWKIIKPFPTVPTENEIKENIRSRSSKLRILEKK